MPITELLGTITQHGQVHLAHDDRGTVCTDNSHTPKVITTVLGVVDDDGHEPLLAILHALDLHPGRLCRRCFGPWVCDPYAQQWAARTNSSHVDLDAGLDALVVDTSVSAYVLDVTQAGRSSADGFTVLVGGCTPHRFGEVANAAARATARRREWSGARLSAVAVRDDEALASFAYRPHDTMVELYRTDRPPSPFATTVNGHRAHRLGWETDVSGGQRGVLPTSAEGTVTITLDGAALIGIDLTAGNVLTWPDGEHAETVAEFPADPPSSFSVPFTWTTPSGEYQGISFSESGGEYIVVWRRDDTRTWRWFARLDRPPATANWMIAFDEWRMRVTGYVITHPYPAWTAAHGATRDVTGLPPAHPDTHC